MSSEALGILWIIIFVVAVVVGIILKYTYLGEYLKDEIISFFTPPPPPSKIDPHNYKPPKKVLADDEVIFEREISKLSPPVTGQAGEVKDDEIVWRYQCPFCGMNLTSHGLHDAADYICHMLREHERELADPHCIPCHVCRIYDWWSDEMVIHCKHPDPYCRHCGGTGIEPIVVETVDDKEVIRQAKVILYDDDLLICPACKNVESLRLKCEVCEQGGALTRREINELMRREPKYRYY